MKKIIGTVLFIAMAYSAFWFYEGSKGKSFIEQKLKEAQISSDSISLSGYPFHYTVSVENPTYVDEFLNAASKGTISFTSNLFGNKLWISRDGEIQVKLNDADDLSSLSLNGQSEFYVESRDSLLINHIFRQLPIEFSKDSPTLILEKLKGASVSGKNLRLEFKDDYQAVIYHLGNLNAGWEQDITDKTQTHRLKISAPESRFELKNIDPSKLSIEDVFTNMMIPDKSHFDFEGTLTIPNDPFDIFDLPQMSLNISKCEVSSTQSHSKSQLSFFIDKKDASNDEISFKISSEGTMPESGYKDQVKKLLAGLKEFSTQDEPESKIIKEMLENNESELINLIPKFHALSPIGLNIDIHSLLKKNGTTYEDLNLKIKDLNLTMSPYSFFSNAQVEFLLMGGEATVKIKLNHYKQMVRDLFGYVNNFAKVLSNISESPEFEVTPNQIDELLKLLRQISDEPKADSEDLQLTIKAQIDGSVMIGEMELTQVMDQIDKIFENPEEQEIPVPVPPVEQ